MSGYTTNASFHILLNSFVNYPATEYPFYRVPEHGSFVAWEACFSLKYRELKNISLNKIT
jgi:hypothetical protein